MREKQPKNKLNLYFRIQNLRNAGMTPEDIGSFFVPKLSQLQVEKLLKNGSKLGFYKLKIKNSENNLVNVIDISAKKRQQYDKIIELYNKKMMYKEIGASLKPPVSESRVSQLIKEARKTTYYGPIIDELILKDKQKKQEIKTEKVERKRQKRYEKFSKEKQKTKEIKRKECLTSYLKLSNKLGYYPITKEIPSYLVSKMYRHYTSPKNFFDFTRIIPGKKI